MRKILLPLLALLLLALPAQAQCPVTLDAPLSGVYIWPEGSAEADALYVYRYSYPQAAGENDLAQLINNTYRYAVDDALGFEIPMLASGMQPGDPQKVVDITYEVTLADEDYLSFRLTKRVTSGDAAIEVISGHVFALTGAGAGRIVSLPVFLELLDAEETDDWLIDRQTNKADRVVREMVWAMIEAGEGDYNIYDDLTFEELEASFYPEEDFYLTEDGAPCFFFQPGVIAPEEDGVPTFVLDLWDLYDEL